MVVRELAKGSMRGRSGKKTRRAATVQEGDDLGVETERDVDSRTRMAQLGFRKVTGANFDSMSDLTMRRHHETVDSIGGGAASTEAGGLIDYDTITDSNSLTSASIISGAYMTGDPFGQSAEEPEDDPDDEAGIETFPEQDLGMQDVPDEETVGRYVEARKKEKGVRRMDKILSQVDRELLVLLQQSMSLASKSGTLAKMAEAVGDSEVAALLVDLRALEKGHEGRTLRLLEKRLNQVS